MERSGTFGVLGPNPADHRFVREPVLPSRAGARDRLVHALGRGGLPVLITGEAGVGKSWLWRRAFVGLAGRWRAVEVDATPSLTPEGFYRWLGRGLGLADAPWSEATDWRLAVEDVLVERAANGEQWVLVVDEAHTAPDDLLEEVRVLGNRLGEPRGFAGLVVIGQTSLLIRLGRRPLLSFGIRLRDRIHLLPLDADERQYVTRTVPEATGRPLGFSERSGALEPAADLARDPAAVPPRNEPVTASKPNTPTVASVADRNREFATPPDSESVLSRASASKPPIEVGDGVVEVGWEAAFEDVETREPTAGDVVGAADIGMTRGPIEPGRESLDPSESIIEPVQDPYAALQAWNEWAENQGREPVTPLRHAEEDAFPSFLRDDEVEPNTDSIPVPPDQRREGPSPAVFFDLRVEGEQEFAPYSQLFSKLRPSRESPGG